MRGWRLSWLLLVGSAAGAQLAPPIRPPSADLVIAVSPALAPAARRAAAAAERHAPETHVRIDAVGSDVAMAALYAGRADAALIGREASDNEIKAYVWIYGHAPVATTVGAGSAATPGLSPALAVQVNAANPLAAITPAQIRAAFRVGASPTWGALGLGGVWATRPIHLVIPDAESGTGRFLRHALLADMVQLDWARVTEIAPTRDDAALDRGIDAAVARDPLALGFGAALPHGRARSVPVAGPSGTIAPGERGYPFARSIMLYAPADQVERLRAFVAALREAPIR